MENEINPHQSSTVEQQEKAAAQQPPATLQFERERRQFRALILANPNYFGNLKTSPFQPVLDIQGNTTFEEIGCVGFQPQFNRLEAVVYVKQPSGYGGGVCSNGTPEYVRFFLTCDNGANWQDLGLTSFTAYDIPEGTEGAKRLEYDVTLQINPSQKFCFINNICRVRAILSWNVPPPPGDHNFTPVWGNVHDTYIQIDPLKLFILGDLLKEANLKLPPQIEAALDLSQPLPASQAKTLSAAELRALYKDKGVEPHRFALAELQKLIDTPTFTESLMSPGFKGVLAGLDINLAEIIGSLFPTDGSTRYEELECIGYNPNLDTLAGVIRVKLPSGYSGGPCTAGSREYVTFWADLNNNGIFETCLGTTSVNVYDINKIPKEGLEYAVFLPANLKKFTQPCEQGPKLIRIRAILSWQVPPPCNNPNFIPVWGNREETLIHIKPGSVRTGHTPFIETVGGMSVTDINGITGLANGPAAVAGFTAIDSPFGGEVIITGHLANPTDISSGAAPLRYSVSVSDDGGATWQALTNTFSVARSQLLNGIWSFLPNATQSDTGGGFYEYREDLTNGLGNAQIFVAGNVLARWKTSGLTGLWLIRIEAKDAANNIYAGNVVTVRLDNQAPQFPAGSFKITSGGGSCADFTIGDVIEGTYEVTDEHFRSLNLSVLPALGGTFTAPAPLPRTYPTVPTSGEAGIWKLDTTGMPKCGYVVRLSAADRTIVNSGFVGFGNETFVGLCLKEKTD